jgi:hypothetical protein
MFNKVVAENPANKVIVFLRHSLWKIYEAVTACRELERQTLEGYVQQAELVKEIIRGAEFGEGINPRNNILQYVLKTLEFIIYKEADEETAGLAREILNSISTEEQRIDQKYRRDSGVRREWLKQNIPRELIRRGEAARRVLQRRS